MKAQVLFRPFASRVYHRIVCFVSTYPLNSDLSGGWGYPPLEQQGREVYKAVLSLITIFYVNKVSYLYLALIH